MIVVPVLMTNCQVSENRNTGPLTLPINEGKGGRAPDLLGCPFRSRVEPR
jgi:hypothetical protein